MVLKVNNVGWAIIIGAVVTVVTVGVVAAKCEFIGSSIVAGIVTAKVGDGLGQGAAAYLSNKSSTMHWF